MRKNTDTVFAFTSKKCQSALLCGPGGRLEVIITWANYGSFI